MKHLKHARIAIATRATADLLLKHLDATLATYKRRQMKHLQKKLETISKHTQHPNKTLATYV
jgi:hypothetical protein